MQKQEPRGPHNARGDANDGPTSQSSATRGRHLRYPSDDPRVRAFLKPCHVFVPIQYASSVFEYDPLDVDALHADANASFSRLVESASAPSGGHGRMLLVLGDSGTGKTHLLRGFRRYVHEEAHGFVCYAQLNANVDDYERYLLKSLISSMSRPYARPSGEKTGLHQLALGLARTGGGALKASIDRLIADTWSTGTKERLTDYIHRLADNLLQQRELARFDPDVIRVLLYALHPAHGTMSRVYKYLCCDYLNDHDRGWLGDVAPRTDKGDPGWMLRQLAQLAFATQQAPMVFMIDQAELAGIDHLNGIAFSRAVSALHGLVNEVSSVVAVVACLSDLYYDVRNRITKSTLDRLEKDPPIARLQVSRTLSEVHAIVGKRLSSMFLEAGVPQPSETDIYPIPINQLEQLEGFRTRDILEWCAEFQNRCVAEGRVLDDEDDGSSQPSEPDRGRDLRIDQIAASWNDKLQDSDVAIPDDDGQVLTLIVAAAKTCAEEMQLVFEASPAKSGGCRIRISAENAETHILIAVTNKSYHGGGFGKQIGALLIGNAASVPVAARTLPFPEGPACKKALDKLAGVGGRRVHVDASTLLCLAASEQFGATVPRDQLAAWRRRDRPLSTLSPLRQMFDLDKFSSGGAHAHGAKSTQDKHAEPPKAGKRPRKKSTSTASAQT